ncbi:hypothetical protein ACHQM5_010494 [Ranunculus cassubicifolius]
MAKEMATTKQVVTTTGGSDTDSNNTSNQQNLTTNNKNTSPRFKGLVPQQNGHWGAQLYVDHDRKWLGTFKSEKEAAMAYDSAALKIRGGDCHRNFPCDDVTVHERKFQDLLSREDVLNMIRDGTYQNKFTEFMRNQSQNVENKVEINLGKEGIAADCGFLYRQLFQKELTPSDVGKLNRLVIPIKSAVKYFPRVSNGSLKKDDKEEEGIVDVQLVFFDRQMKSWTFRYCFWKSSRSFVFTKGWNKFVKEKDLKSKDIVTFYQCEPRNKDGSREQQQVFCLIDVEYNTSENGNVYNNDTVDDLNRYPPQEDVDLQLGLSCSSSDSDSRQEEEPEAKRPKLTLPLLETKKGVWLFGARIS